MAKSHIKVRMVQAKPDSAFRHYTKKPTKGEKAINLAKNIIQILVSTKYSQKKLPPHSK